MNIKKFLEYYSIGYEDSDYLQYKDVKIDNITLLTKAMELLKIKYNNLYTDNPNTETFENKKSLLIKINRPNRFINVIYLRCNDDYIYIDNYVQGNSFYYKCDQLSGFKSFLKSDLIDKEYENYIKCGIARELFDKLIDNNYKCAYDFSHIKNMSGSSLYYVLYNENDYIYINPFVDNYNTIAVECDTLDLFYTIELKSEIPDTESKMHKFIYSYFNTYIPKIINEL